MGVRLTQPAAELLVHRIDLHIASTSVRGSPACSRTSAMDLYFDRIPAQSAWAAGADPARSVARRA